MMDEQNDPQHQMREAGGDVTAETSGEFGGAPTTPLDEQAHARQAEHERAAAPQPVAPGQYPSQPYPAPMPYPGYPPTSGGRGYTAGPRERRRASGWVKASAGCLVALAAVMACCALGTGFAAGLQIVSTTTSATQSQSFAVTGTPDIVLNATAGNVSIIAGESSTVDIKLNKSARAVSRGLAQQMLDQMRFDAAQNGNTITITNSFGNWGPNPFVFNRSEEMTISVPAATDLDTTLSAGNLTITGTTGALRVHSTAGNVTLDGVTLSGSSLLHLTAGDITLHGTLATHTALEVDDTAGNVSLFLPADTSAHLDATVTAGRVSTSGFASDRSSDSGTLSEDLNANPTSTISINDTAGDVSIVAN